MVLFSCSNKVLKELKEKPFKLEKDLQMIVEANLQKIANLTFVKNEFSLKGYRIDTLAYDEKANAFVIIEYKRNKSVSVVDQGFTYLNLMLNNKAEFILECNERLDKKLKRKDIDWSQTRVVFVASNFNNFQRESTNFKDIGIELWEAKLYENNTISITPIKKSSNAESLKKITKDSSELEKITKEIKVYTEDQLLEKANNNIKELYEDFKNAILNLDSSIEVEPRKQYISFKKSSNVCDIEICKNSLYLFLNAKWGTLNDSRQLFRNMSKIGHHGNGDYKVTVHDDKDIEYIISVLKQLL